MVAARKDLVRHEQQQAPIILPGEMVTDALNNLLALVVDESGKEIAPGAYAQMQIIHEQTQQLVGMVIGLNAALNDMTFQRDVALNEANDATLEAAKSAHRDIIRDISREYKVTPAVAEYLLFIVTGGFGGDNIVSNYVNSILYQAVGETADEIQDALEREAAPPEGYDDDDE